MCGLAAVGGASLLMSTSTLGSTLGFANFLFWYLINGFGMSFIDISVNCITADWDNAGAMNLLHFGFGLGAVTFPQIFTFLTTKLRYDFRSAFFVTGAFSLICFLIAWATRFKQQPPMSNPGSSSELSGVEIGIGENVEMENLRSNNSAPCDVCGSYPCRCAFEEGSQMQQSGGSAHSGGLQYLGSILSFRSTYPLLLLAILFYVGCELIVGGWTYSLYQEIGYSDQSVLGTSLFWMGLLTGRLLCSVVVPKIPGTNTPRGSMIIILILSFFGTLFPLLLSLAPKPPFSFVFVFASGLADSGVFPHVAQLVGTLFLDPVTGSNSMSVGVLLVAANLGGAFLPLATGVIADHLSIRFGIALGGVCALSVFATVGIFFWKYRSKS